jgi:hypothetical protein
VTSGCPVQSSSAPGPSKAPARESAARAARRGSSPQPRHPLVTQQTQGTSRQKLYAVRERILPRMCLEECRESPYEPADVVRLHGARVELRYEQAFPISHPEGSPCCTARHDEDGFPRALKAWGPGRPRNSKNLLTKCQLLQIIMAAMPPGVLQTGARQGRNPNRQCRGRCSCRPRYFLFS